MSRSFHFTLDRMRDVSASSLTEVELVAALLHGRASQRLGRAAEILERFESER